MAQILSCLTGVFFGCGMSAIYWRRRYAADKAELEVVLARSRRQELAMKERTDELLEGLTELDAVIEERKRAGGAS